MDVMKSSMSIKGTISRTMSLADFELEHSDVIKGCPSQGMDGTDMRGCNSNDAAPTHIYQQRSPLVDREEEGTPIISRDNSVEDLNTIFEEEIGQKKKVSNENLKLADERDFSREVFRGIINEHVQRPQTVSHNVTKFISNGTTPTFQERGIVYGKPSRGKSRISRITSQSSSLRNEERSWEHAKRVEKQREEANSRALANCQGVDRIRQYWVDNNLPIPEFLDKAVRKHA